MFALENLKFNFNFLNLFYAIFAENLGNLFGDGAFARKGKNLFLLFLIYLFFLAIRGKPLSFRFKGVQTFTSKV